MKQKLAIARKQKKGFTLVELVIVIAILAILAAIAIPVITTTINNSKISVMESDATTTNMLVREAVNVSKVHLRGVTYNGKAPYEASIADVLAESNIETNEDYFSRYIGGQEYIMVFTTHLGVEISGGKKNPTDVVGPIESDTLIKDLDP